MNSRSRQSVVFTTLRPRALRATDTFQPEGVKVPRARGCPDLFALQVHDALFGETPERDGDRHRGHVV
jgi:hypothetical protein